jgi:ABC-type oligopeptide transport system substrate-binding subunit/class 3 adenylate cyclase
VTEEKPNIDREKLEEAIAIQESMRGTIADEVVDVAIDAIRKQLEELKPVQTVEQRKQVTVLFADLSDFTPMAERMDAEEVGQIMSAYFTAITPAIGKHGGIIEKFIGDAVMAVFGLAQARENDPENGVRAALEMQQALVELNERMIAEWGFRLGMRIGVNTGPVVAKYLGGEREQDFTVVGDTVNLTSRLENAAPVGGVLISHDTYRHVRGVFTVKEQEPLQVKGKVRPVHTYLVQQAKPRAFRMLTRGVEGIETRMIGRDAELLMLQNMFRDAIEDAEVHIVTVVGDAGVGKSRLLYEFEKWIVLLPEEIWYFKGRATPEAEAMPYTLIRRMLAHRFDILESDSAVEVREKFRAGMSATLNSDQADLVGQLIGLDFSASQAVQAQLGSESFGELATAHLAKYLRTMASEPTVIFLEDIHWADDSSLDLLDHLVTVVPDTRLLVVCLARPSLYERRPGWGEGQEIHTQINLKPLSRRASRALVGEILQRARDVPTDLRDLIVEGAEGNPFYVEELIKMLIEDGVIVPGEEHWWIELDRLAEIHVPPTLAGVLQARLDSLPPEEKMLLQRAAVVGRLFWDAAVVELRAKEGSGLDEEEIASLLETVRERELIFRREHSAFTGAEEYIFKHALLRDVTYETVLLGLRRVYHKQVARWLEVAAEKRIGEYLGLIAGHYELAGEGEKAVEYLLRAGDQARLTYACQEASGYYQRALPLLEDQGKQDQAARTLMKLGLTYDLAFDFQGARQAYEQGFALWQRAAEVQQENLPAVPHPLRLAAGDPATLDSTKADNVTSSAKIIQLFSGLVELRPDVGVVPDVAQSWEVLQEGRKYLFHLREDVRWSDGRPVTAGDFEYAWKRVLGDHTTFTIPRLLYDVKGAMAFHQGEVSDPDSVGVRALDDVTLAVELEGPAGYYLHLLANAVTFPVPRHTVELHGEAWTEPEKIVTCGPFKLESWQQGERMTLVRNPDYHGRFTGNLECVELLLHDKGPAAGLGMLEMYTGDQLDVMDVTAFEVGRIRQRHAGEYRKVPRLLTIYLQFDVSRPPFDDVRARRALVLATDREALVKAARPDCFPATGGFVPPGMPGHSPGIGLPYDPRQARQLLAEAGYPDGRGFPVVKCLALPDRIDIGENLQAQWKENLGVKIEWEMVESHAFLTQLGEHVPHLFILGWRADYPDPDNFLRVRIGDIQRQKWRNEGYDNLVEEARRSLDQGERIKLYEEAERILAEEAPIMPIFHRSTRLLVKSWVTRFPTTGLREWFFKDVIIKPHQ